MKSFDVWMEGYRVMEGSGTAKFYGTYAAESFPEACKQAMIDHKMYGDGFYNSEENTYWGCNFYDNERDARKYFG